MAPLLLLLVARYAIPRPTNMVGYWKARPNSVVIDGSLPMHPRAQLLMKRLYGSLSIEFRKDKTFVCHAGKEPGTGIWQVNDDGLVTLTEDFTMDFEPPISKAKESFYLQLNRNKNALTFRKTSRNAGLPMIQSLVLEKQ